MTNEQPQDNAEAHAAAAEEEYIRYLKRQDPPALIKALAAALVDALDTRSLAKRWGITGFLLMPFDEEVIRLETELDWGRSLYRLTFDAEALKRAPT